LIVTIDGPAGAGKSTAARALAARLGFTYLDTGALYRAIAWRVLQAGVPADNVDRVCELFAATRVDFKQCSDRVRVYVDDVDVTDAIRTPAVTQCASQIAAFEPVRDLMVPRQREFARGQGLVAEGRDMGTVVFPEAQKKFFLDAGVEERARRRLAELEAKGATVDREKVLADIRERDERDTTREVCPLRQAPDAEYVDTGRFGVEEMVDYLANQVKALRDARPQDE